jgi:hypothetical protein
VVLSCAAVAEEGVAKDVLLPSQTPRRTTSSLKNCVDFAKAYSTERELTISLV